MCFGAWHSLFVIYVQNTFTSQESYFPKKDFPENNFLCLETLTIQRTSSNLKWTTEGALVNRPAEMRWCSLRTREPDLDNASVGRVHFLTKIPTPGYCGYLGVFYLLS